MKKKSFDINDRFARKKAPFRIIAYNMKRDGWIKDLKNLY